MYINKIGGEIKFTAYKGISCVGSLYIIYMVEKLYSILFAKTIVPQRFLNLGNSTTSPALTLRSTM